MWKRRKHSYLHGYLLFYSHKHTVNIYFSLGEFGSVVEGHLRQTDGTSEKVAVKTMKGKFCFKYL